MSKEAIQSNRSTMRPVNYEQVCAQMGIRIVEKCTNNKIKKSEIVGTLNKSIGVLQSSGIYAFVIWLEYRKVGGNDQTAVEAQKEVYDLIKTYAREFNIWDKADDVTPDKVKQFINHEKVTIEELFLLKGLLQKMLTYGLYSARALASDTEKDLQEQDGKVQ